MWCTRAVSDVTFPLHHSCRVQEQLDVAYRLTRNVSRRGSILAGGHRPDVEEKWTHNLKSNVCVPRSGKECRRFHCVDANKGDFEIKLYSAYWSVCCKGLLI